ncbi:TetR family transcriptional regulator [Noviherbaspirillum cavernae]|uniref:TetR family transcriptional regulator n=1 Tax=Noviherbaspirillum cavernae TaxID=2320862 RepID=A0A418WYN4_9BURK|nr:TniQ family protein [Noviherbaspirillum cavernae]RJG05364.1 TetR family transcriptional regulator [Noviherbaspirillum cavernae]
MMNAIHNPRSTLHAVTPYGVSTSDVESLTSYFCRVAHSHSMTAQKLAEWVLKHFEQSVCEKYYWYQRNFSSMSVESEQWAAWLGELTGVGSLDQLTLAPLRNLVGTPGLAPRADRWCPCCIEEDRYEGRDTYYRLAWDVAPVTACLRHKVQLVSTCPHCNKENVRNRAAIVVPGYCTSCGGFLGDAEAEPATPEELWVVRQVGQTLQQRPQVAEDGLTSLLGVVIERMAANNMATFAKQYGFSKSGVWHWMNKGGLPSLKAWLTIALHGGIGLDKLFAGDVESWVVPREKPQFEMPLSESPRAGIRSRELDWDEIRTSLMKMLELPVPISINEACERVGVGRKHLYLRVNAEARAIADRYSRYRSEVRLQKEVRLREQIGEILDARLAAGYEGMSARDVWSQLDEQARSVESVFRHISVVMAERQK